MLNIDTACGHLKDIISTGKYRVVITHGNGPQVGNVASAKRGSKALEGKAGTIIVL